MKARDERKELERMIDQSPETIANNANVPANEISAISQGPLVDENFGELKIKCELEARTMINNAISFMFPQDMIENNEYLKNKIEVDVMTLAGMVYQLRSNEAIQKTLMQQINLGATHPRYFEVFSGMAKTIGDLNKQLIQTVEAIRETYRNMKEDVKEKRMEALGPKSTSNGNMLTTGDGGIITRGTKELINEVRRQKNERLEKNIDDATIVPDFNFNDPDSI